MNKQLKRIVYDEHTEEPLLLDKSILRNKQCGILDITEQDY